MMNQSELKKILYYNQKTGVFIWMVSKSNRVKVGDIAGSLHIIHGYIKIKINGKLYQAHRLAFLYVNGMLPKDEVDHINHNKADNRFSNLREVTHRENGKNLSKITTNTSGIMGVSWHKSNLRWIAFITVLKKRINLGSFVQFHEAVNARKNAEVLYGFHKNHGEKI